MRTQSINQIKNLIKSEVRIITAQVKETLAYNYPKEMKRKVFSAAELWDIQKRGRTMMSRRRFI